MNLSLENRIRQRAYFLSLIGSGDETHFLAHCRTRGDGRSRDRIRTCFPESHRVDASSDANGGGEGDRNGVRGGDNACVEISAAIRFAVLQRQPTPDRSGIPIFAAYSTSSSLVERSFDAFAEILNAARS
jgi:hypothetical protein